MCLAEGGREVGTFQELLHTDFRAALLSLERDGMTGCLAGRLYVSGERRGLLLADPLK